MTALHQSAMTKSDYDEFVKKNGRTPSDRPMGVRPRNVVANTTARRVAPKSSPMDTTGRNPNVRKL